MGAVLGLCLDVETGLWHCQGFGLVPGEPVAVSVVTASAVTAWAPKGRVRSVLQLQFEFTSHRKAPSKKRCQPIHKNSP